MGGALFDVVDVVLEGVVGVEVVEAVEPHLVVAERASHIMAMDDAADTLVKDHPASRAAYPDLVIEHVVGGKSARAFHALSPFPAPKMRQKDCQAVAASE